jgi:drug/metabolite transporter (DMT)-like permease
MAGGLTPLAVVAIRTGLAAMALLLLFATFQRKSLYIYPLGLAGCLLAGGINGVGSLLYYFALARLGASVGQLLFSLYPFFVALWLTLDHQPPSRLTLLRVGAAALATLLLTSAPGAAVDRTGLLLMLGAALLYALHLPINQRVLFEVPAPTVTLYTLLAMSAICIPAFLLFEPSLPSATVGWAPLLGLAAVTFVSRLLLFLGVKRIGGMQTALLGLAELIVTLVLGALFLGDRLGPLQWLGAVLLAGSLMLVYVDRGPSNAAPTRSGWFSWISGQEIQKRAFGPFD